MKKDKASAKQTDRKKEGNIYDKIFRENLQDIFIPLVAKRLNIAIKKYQPLPDKQQTTVQRETDAFLLIETMTGEQFILHLEFQTKDEPDMVYRMAEYHGIELRMHQLPIKHVVIYIGEQKPKMRSQLRKEEIFTGFELVNVHSFNPKQWLSSQVPEEILLAVLSDYPKEQAEAILRLIVRRLRQICKIPSELKEYLNQLVILSRLRKLEPETIKITQEMPIYFNVEEDYLYKLGQQAAQKQFDKEKKNLEEELAKEQIKRAKAEERQQKKLARAEERQQKMLAKAKERERKMLAKAKERQQKRVEAEKAKLLERERKRAEVEKAKLLEKEQKRAEVEKAKLLEKEQKRAEVEKAKLLEKEQKIIEAERLKTKQAIQNLLITKVFDDKQIAEILQVAIKLVEEVKKELNNQ